jgi:hypothetical protein
MFEDVGTAVSGWIRQEKNLIHILNKKVFDNIAQLLLYSVENCSQYVIARFSRVTRGEVDDNKDKNNAYLSFSLCSSRLIFIVSFLRHWRDSVKLSDEGDDKQAHGSCNMGSNYIAASSFFFHFLLAHRNCINVYQNKSLIQLFLARSPGKEYFTEKGFFRLTTSFEAPHYL